MRKKYCSKNLNHLGYVKSHDFYDNPYINLKHDQNFFYNFFLVSNVFIRSFLYQIFGIKSYVLALGPPLYGVFFC